MPTLLWPRRSLATFGCTPGQSRCVACAWRKIMEANTRKGDLPPSKRTHSALDCGAAAVIHPPRVDHESRPPIAECQVSAGPPLAQRDAPGVRPSPSRIAPRCGRGPTLAACIARLPSSVLRLSTTAIWPARYRRVRHRRAAISPRRRPQRPASISRDEHAVAAEAFQQFGGLLEVVSLMLLALDLRRIDRVGRIAGEHFPRTACCSASLSTGAYDAPSRRKATLAIPAAAGERFGVGLGIWTGFSFASATAAQQRHDVLSTNLCIALVRLWGETWLNVVEPAVEE